ncbi:MAG: hypothetical protein WKF84_13385 [Pyrinomonadaceae bacterium]
MARSLAKRMLSESGPDVRARAAYGFRLCTSRQAKGRELDQLSKLYDEELARLTADKASAHKMLGDLAVADEARNAELAAWTVVSNVLLNLDETVTKE